MTELEADLRVRALGNLAPGWDGRDAPPPRPRAVEDALSLAVLLGEDARGLEAGVHADGSVLLEAGDGSTGSLRLVGDGRLAHASRATGAGVVALDRADDVRRTVALVLAGMTPD